MRGSFAHPRSLSMSRRLRATIIVLVSVVVLLVGSSSAFAAVSNSIDFDGALEWSGWFSSPDGGLLGQWDNVWHSVNGFDAPVDGDCLKSGDNYGLPYVWDEKNVLQTHVNGPGQAEFWWRIDEWEGAGDIRFYVDGDPYNDPNTYDLILAPTSTSRDTGWRKVLVNIPEGSHELSWRQWSSWEHVYVPWGTPFVESHRRVAFVDGFKFTGIPTVGAYDALDTTNPPCLVQPGTGSWFGQMQHTWDGEDSLSSDFVKDGGTSEFYVDVTGPGELGFRWMTSCSDEWSGLSGRQGDWLSVSVDGTEIRRIHGETGWLPAGLTIPAGTHRVTWEYSKDGAGAAGLDRGFVDQLTLTPAGATSELAPSLRSTTHASEVVWYPADLAEFRFQGVDFGYGVSGYSYVLDQAFDTIPDETPDTTEEFVSLSDLDDGVHYFHVRAVDGVGFWGPTAHQKVMIDTSAPVGTFELAHGGAFATSRTIEVTSNISDAASGVASMRFSLNGAWDEWRSFNSTETLVLPDRDGVHALAAQYRDRAGNIETLLSLVTLDRIAPTGTMEVESGAAATTERVVDVEATVSGATQMRYSMDGGATWGLWEPFAVSSSLTLPDADGVYAVRGEFADDAGNLLSLDQDIVLDREIPYVTPSISGDAWNGWRRGPVTITLDADDGPGDTSGVAAVFYRIDTEPFQLYSGPFEFDEDGEWTLECYAVDGAGNSPPEGFNQRVDLKVDNTGPEVKGVLLGSSGGPIYPDFWYRDGLTIRCEVSDAHVAVSTTKYLLKDAWAPIFWYPGYTPPEPTTYTAPFAALPDTQNSIMWVATDVLGNETVVYEQLRVDARPPTTTSDIDSAPRQGPVLVSLDAVDAMWGWGFDASGVKQTICWTSEPGSVFLGEYDGPFQISAEGTTTVWFYSFDVAGNYESLHTEYVCIDNTAPSGSFTLADGASHVASTAVSLDLTAIEGADTAIFECDGVVLYDGAFDASLTALLLPDSDGMKTVVGTFTDFAGNSYSTEAEVALDRGLPSITDLYSSTHEHADDWYPGTRVTFDWHPADAPPFAPGNVEGFSYVFDGLSDTVPDATIDSIYPEVSESGLTEGERWFHVRAIDAAGNAGATVHRRVLVDFTAPTGVAQISGGSEFTTSTAVTVGLSMADGLCGLDSMRFNLGSGWQPWEPYSASKALLLPAGDGVKLVQVQVRDLAGNAHEVFDSIVLDTSGPEGELQLDGGAVHTRSRDVVAQMDVDDALEMRLDAGGGLGPWVEYSPVVPIGLVGPEGTRTLAVEYRDAAGNLLTLSDAIIYDATAPVTTSNVGGGWSSSEVTVSLSASDSVSGVAHTYYAIDGGPDTTYTAPFGVSADGEHQIAFWSVDAADNVEVPRGTTVAIDQSVPTTSDDCPDAWQDSPFDVQVLSADSVSDIASIDITVTQPPPGGASTATVAGPTALVPVTSEGTTTIEYTATDLAGNRSAQISVFGLLDVTRPQVDVTATSEWSSVAVTVTVSASDSCSGLDAVRCQTDADGLVPYVAPYRQALEGIHDVRGVATDRAGNVAEQTVTTRVDYTAPTTIDDALEAYVDIAEFSLEATDSLSGVAHTRWRLDGSSWTTGTIVRVDSLGDHVVEYSSVDLAGNAEETRTARFSLFADGTYRVSRIHDASRYSTAVRIARKAFDPAGDGSWPGVTDIVIASGEDRAAADPLSASGLCWAYDAPLFLVSSTSVPREVTDALREIVSANEKVTVHVVGGSLSVPAGRYSELVSGVDPSSVALDRVLMSGDRYDMAAAIAQRAKDSNGGVAPEAVLVANGADPSKFFDALSLSPIAAAKGYPILLVSATDVPGATARTIAEFDPGTVIVGGGKGSVSDTVYGRVGGTSRWAGSDRYAAALAVADGAVSRGWLSRRVVGVAAKLPDANTGGSACGRLGGVLVLTDGSSLTPSTGYWLARHAGSIDECLVFGGPASVSAKVQGQIAAKLQ